MSSLPRRRVFDLVGESHINADGSGRQATLRQMTPGEPIVLVREQNNPHDVNAILVVSDRLAVGIGHLCKEDAAVWAPLIDAELPIKSRVHELTGGLKEYPSFGCRVFIVGVDKAFSPYRELGAEQVHYQHAPVWRAKIDSPPKPRTLRKGKSRGGLMRGLLKGLFK